MADKRISDLTSVTATDIGDFEEIETAGGNSRKRRSGIAGTSSGTAFPGSPTTGDRFYRSDRKIEYAYDGTRWLSTQILHLQFATQDTLNPLTATARVRAVNPEWSRYDIYVERFVVSMFQTVGAAGNFYTARLCTSDGAGAEVTLGADISFSGIALNTWTGGADSTNTAITSGVEFLCARFTKTGTATAYGLASMEFRLVG
jgi:hypothetical protein